VAIALRTFSHAQCAAAASVSTSTSTNLAAEARDEVGVPHGPDQQLRDFAQHGVADRVRVAVVDPLEVVDVEQRDRERPLVARRARELVGEALVEQAPVAEAGQAVLVGLALELLEQLRLLLVGDAQRQVELLQLGVDVGQLDVAQPVDLRFAPRGGKLVARLHRLQVPLRRLPQHLALERVESPVHGESLAVVPALLVQRGEGFAAFADRLLEVVPLGGERRLEAAGVGGTPRHRQAPERRQRVDDAAHVPVASASSSAS
jgi:hypothetical protein